MNGRAERNTRWRVIATGFTLVLLGSSVLAYSTSTVDPLGAVGAVVALAGLCALIVWQSSATDRSSDDSDVWDAIPSWQYGGRHVESGGMSRGEQEQALQEIQQQADELAEDPYKK